MAKIQSSGYTFSEAFNTGLDVLLGAASNDLETLKREFEELKRERDSIDARLDVIGEKIVRLDAEQEERDAIQSQQQERVNIAVEDISNFIRKSRFEPRINKMRVTHLSEKYGVSRDTITDFVERQASEEEIRALIESTLEAKA
jgi:hypothetical protein